MRVVVKAPAKINLTLDVVGEREDGYHLLQSVMQSVDLCDTVIVSDEKTGDGIVVECDEDVPVIENNIAVTAVKKFFEAAEIEPCDITVKIKKKIPVAAGMGGGSTDAAAVLTALDEIFENPISEDEMLELAAEIGADVPFCLSGGTALCEGIGGLINPLPNLPECYFVLVKPFKKESTAEMFRQYDLNPSKKKIETDKMLDAVCVGDLEDIGKCLDNVFLDYVDKKIAEKIRDIMHENGALGCSLTGSGPTFFGIFENRGDASDCVSDLEKEYDDDVFLVSPKNIGCEIDD